MVGDHLDKIAFGLLKRCDDIFFLLRGVHIGLVEFVNGLTKSNWIASTCSKGAAILTITSVEVTQATSVVVQTPFDRIGQDAVCIPNGLETVSAFWIPVRMKLQGELSVGLGDLLLGGSLGDTEHVIGFQTFAHFSLYVDTNIAKAEAANGEDEGTGSNSEMLFKVLKFIDFVFTLSSYSWPSTLPSIQVIDFHSERLERWTTKINRTVTTASWRP